MTSENDKKIFRKCLRCVDKLIPVKLTKSAMKRIGKGNSVWRVVLVLNSNNLVPSHEYADRSHTIEADQIEESE